MRRLLLTFFFLLPASCCFRFPAAAAETGIYNSEDGLYYYQFSDGTEFTGSAGDGSILNDVVSFHIPEAVTVRLWRGEEEISYDSDQFLVEAADYKLTATHGEEEIKVSFTIIPMKLESGYDITKRAVQTAELSEVYDPVQKRFVETVEEGVSFLTTIPNGMVSSGAVLFHGFTPELIFVMTRDGEDIGYESGQVLSETGQYHLQVILLPTVDLSGMEEPTMEQLQSEELPSESFSLLSRDQALVSDFYFTIASHPVSFLHTIKAPKDYEISQLQVDGALQTPESRTRLAIRTDGRYRLTLTGTKAKMPQLITEFTVDTQPPLLRFENVEAGGAAKRWFRFESTEEGAVFEVLQDGRQTETGKEIQIPGQYQIRVSDQAGNSTTYLVLLKRSYLRLILSLVVALPFGLLGAAYLYTSKQGFTAR